MATIKDIADKLGIAVSTVSKGLNGASDISAEMRQQVLDTAVEMGYASKKMRTLNTRKVCIFIENMDYENIDQFGYDIIVGFKSSAVTRHWDVSVVPTGYSGAFFLGFTLHDDWIRQLNKTTVPTVLLDNYIERNHHVGYVGTDSSEGIDLAVDHLYELEHKKIAFLNGSKNSMVSEQRQQAFIHSLAKHGLKAEENLMEYGYYVPDCAKDYVPGFIKNGATAIMCASDLIASGVIYEVHKLGLRIPEDISVIGFDDLPIAERLSPPLTTIRQDRNDMGKSALLLLEGLINHVSVSKLLLRAKFIQRKSTGPCKN
jgi:LacI family transcriptional regulator